MYRVCALVALLSTGCGGAAPVTPDPPPSRPAPSVVYEVRWHGSEDLDVTVRARGGFDVLGLEPGAEQFVSSFAVRGADGAPAPFTLDRGVFRIPACEEACSISYRIALGSLADVFDNPMFAGRVGGAVFAPPTTWLVHPFGKPPGDFELVVHTPHGVEHVSGLAGGEGGGAFRADLADLPQAPYAAFGDLRRRSIALAGGSVVDLAIAGPEARVGDDAIEAWVRSAATNVESYAARFPVERAAVFVIVEPGTRVGTGSALGNGGSSILVRLGDEAGEPELARDWIMTHEMVHLSMPGLHARHNWMEEGLATYVEPVARAQRGLLAPEQVWAEWYFDMRQGLPGPDDGGLDGTSTWGRTYWGGAIFWLVVDLEIRERFGGRFSLQDCVRATVAAGGNIAVRWSATKFVEVCDGALPEPVVQPLYELHANEAVTVDLEALFARLGVRGIRRGRVELDDAAPGAAIRRAITGERRVAKQGTGPG